MKKEENLKSIVDRELYNKIQQTPNSLKDTKINESNFRPAIYWYLCAGLDFKRIEQLLQKAEECQLKAPDLFILTDNAYVISDQGKVVLSYNHDVTESGKQFLENFRLIKTYSELEGFSYSENHSNRQINVADEAFLASFFEVKSFFELTRENLSAGGFSEKEIEYYFDCNLTEEQLIQVREDPSLLLDMIALGGLQLNEDEVQSRNSARYNHLQSFLDSKRRVAALYHNPELDVFVLLLATDNLRFAASPMGQKTYAIIGEQNWGHNIYDDIAPCLDFKVFFQLPERGQVDLDSNQVTIILLPVL